MQERQTKQKSVIYEALCTLDHPTATEVYAWLQETNPTISRATVFRVLAGFADGGKALELRMAGSDVRYDFNTMKHYHVHCRECGKVADVELPWKGRLPKVMTWSFTTQVMGEMRVSSTPVNVGSVVTCRGCDHCE